MEHIRRPQKETLFFLLVALVAIVPLWLISIDFWDGRIIDYALETGDMRGMHAWLFESRWHLLYALNIAIGSTAKLLFLPHHYLFVLLDSLALLGIAHEVRRYAARRFGFTPAQAAMAAALALLFPAWHVLTSSVLTMHILCTWGVLLGFRLFLEHGAAKKAAGLAIILCSFQMNSNFVFLIGLGAAELWLECCTHRRYSHKAFLQLVFLTAVSTATFIVLTHFLPTQGTYEDYNKVTFTGIAQHSLYIVIFYLAYWIWLYEFTLIFLGGLVVTAVVIEAMRASRRLPLISHKMLWGFLREMARSWPQLIACFALFSAAALPYALVIKDPVYDESYDWSARHAFLLCLPVCLYLGVLLRAHNAAYAGCGVTTRWRYATHAILLVNFAWLLYAGYCVKAEREAFEMALIETLKHAPPPAIGSVTLHIADSNHAVMRNYESNWIMWKSYGRLDWVANMGSYLPQKEVQIDNELYQTLLTGSDAHKLSSLLPLISGIPCHTDINIEGRRYTYLQSWLWLIGVETLTPPTIASEDTSCQKQ